MKKIFVSLLSAITGFIVGESISGKMNKKVYDKEKMMSKKHLALFLMMNQWVQVKQEGKKLADYLYEQGYRNIAIYGMSYAGETLVNELRGSNINISYGIDKKADSLYSDIEIISLEDELKDVDAIIVTAITFFDEIEEKLSHKINCPVISLEDILYEV